jgi:hypothetical protein
MQRDGKMAEILLIASLSLPVLAASKTPSTIPKKINK